MKIKYSPTYTTFLDCTVEFLQYIQNTLVHDLTDDELTIFKRVNNIPICDAGLYYVYGNTITIYSGFLKQILIDIKRGVAPAVVEEMSATVEKFNPSGIVISDKLYPHQKRIVEACLKGRRGIVKSPTGSGKSFVIAELVNIFHANNLRVLISVPTIVLLHQMAGSLRTFRDLNGLTGDFPIGKVGDGVYDFQDVTIGIPNSLCKLEKTAVWLSNYDVLIADEVHTCANPTYATVLSVMANRKITVGLSATPKTGGANNIFLQGFFGDRLIDINESDMINSNVIMEPEFKFIKAPSAFVPNHLAKQAVKISELSTRSRYKVLAETYKYVIANNTNRNKLIVNEAIARLNMDIGPIILIVNKIKGADSHGEVLRSSLLDAGYDLPIMSGYISKKKKEGILNDLKEERILGCIAGPKVLTAGISIPSLSTIILCGAGRSDSDFIQRVGRLLRKKDGKGRPLVIDFIDSQFWFKNQSSSRMCTARSIYGEENITTL